MKLFADVVAPVAMFAIVALAAQAANAHGPTRQKAEESIVIDAPPAKIWALVGDFNGLDKWVPPVEASSATNGNTVGSVRTLSITGGEKLNEVLESYDAAGMKLGYKMREPNTKVLPVNNYSANITVAAQGASASKVTWRGAFYRGFMNNNPPAELNDEAALKAVSGLYKVSLEKLKKVAEAAK
ncbi:MAG: SRPBCC family protein [Herminiimonas sp.]|nr:SRPBCC family protein [Herminiimonas sp.]